jgi:hypothetical protein
VVRSFGKVEFYVKDIELNDVKNGINKNTILSRNLDYPTIGKMGYTYTD